MAILFSQVKVQSADQSETFLISGIPKEYEDLTESVQLEWFLQDIDSDETVQVHADAFLYVEDNGNKIITFRALLHQRPHQNQSHPHIGFL